MAGHRRRCILGSEVPGTRLCPARYKHAGIHQGLKPVRTLDPPVAAQQQTEGVSSNASSKRKKETSKTTVNLCRCSDWC